MAAGSIPGQMLEDTCEVDAAAAAGALGQLQDDNCEVDARPWSPDSEDDYSDMPSLANASPAEPSGPPSGWNPPALSPVRNFLAVPPQGSSEDPQQMDLDESDTDAMPALLSVSDFSIQLRPTISWSPYPWAQQPTVQLTQQGQQTDDERRERANLLNAFRQMRPPRATGPRSNRPSSRRTTGPQTARTAWLVPPVSAPPAAQPASLTSSSLNPVDALYASAVQQVFSRTARLSADLLGGSFASEVLLRQGNEQRQQQRQQEEQQEYLQMQQVKQVPLCAEVCHAPTACSFLQPGMPFSGKQKLLQQGNRREDQWAVRVVLHDVDLSRGHVSGSMQALDVEGSAGPIDTFFEGHIVDDVHNTFWTQTWGASRETDLRHWSKFEGFAGIKPLVLRHAGRCGQLQQHPTIFMRWKEQFFVNTKEECGLTIAGFYYVALERSTGALRGLYYDPSSSPFQELSLQVEHGSGSASNSNSRRSSASAASATNGDCRMSSSSGGSSSGSIDSSGVSFGTFSFA